MVRVAMVSTAMVSIARARHDWPRLWVDLLRLLLLVAAAAALLVLLLVVLVRGVRACDGAEWRRHLEPSQDGALERIDEALLLVDDGEADGREAQAVGEQERLGRHELG